MALAHSPALAELPIMPPPPAEMLTLRCHHCRKVFERKRSAYERNKRHNPGSTRVYCCHTCVRLDRKQNTPHITRPCGHCGKAISRPLKDVRYSKQKNFFCDRKCHADYRRDNRVIKLICRAPDCRKPFQLPAVDYKDRVRKRIKCGKLRKADAGRDSLYCSRRCASSWARRKQTA